MFHFLNLCCSYWGEEEEKTKQNKTSSHVLQAELTATEILGSFEYKQSQTGNALYQQNIPYPP